MPINFNEAYSQHCYTSSGDFLGGLSAYSFACWFKVDTISGATRRIVAKYSGAQYQLYHQFAATGQAKFNTIDNNTNQSKAWGGDGAGGPWIPSVGTWYFCVYTFESVGGVCTPNLWIDGVSVTGTPGDVVSGATLLTTSGSSVMPVSATTFVGCNGGVTNFLDGQLEHVAFWNRKISDDEIRAMYNARLRPNHQSLMKGLIAYWPLDRPKSGGASPADAGFKNHAVAGAGGQLTNSPLYTNVPTWTDDSPGLNYCRPGAHIGRPNYWPHGCYRIYRGSGHIDNIDYEHPLTSVTHKGILKLSNQDSHHQPNINYFYAARKISATGKQEQGTMAIVELSLDQQGKQQQLKPNCIKDLRAQAVADGKIRLNWWYWSLGQKTQPDHFEVYSDNGTGTIDYQNPIAEIQYDGGYFYEYLSESYPDQKTYRFSVRSVAKNDTEDGNTAYVEIAVDLTGSEPLEGLSGQAAL